MKNLFKVLFTVVVALGIGLPARSAALPQAQLAGAQPAGAQATAQPQPPLTVKEVVQLVKKNKKGLQKISPEIVSRGVAFDMTPEIEEKLKGAGATPDFIANLKNLGPTARANMAAGTGNKVAVPPEESEAFQGIQNELDPDRKIQFVNDFAAKYPKSVLLTYVYFLAQGAEMEKGDVSAVVSYGEKSLALKSDNFNALMIMAKILPLPQSLKDDPNPDTKLNEAEKDGQKALDLVNTLDKAAGETDDAFQKRKALYLANIHSGLAMVHLQRAMGGLGGIDQQELGKSEAEYKLAVSVPSEASPEDYFRLGEVYEYENKVDDAIENFTKASQLSQDNPGLKNLADQKIAELKSKKK
jgi:tetratricopeptide (TPR) repeat protein